MGKQVTNEEFKKEIQKIHPNIIMKTPYINSKTKITSICKIDGHEWTVYPRTLKEKGCPVCSGSPTAMLTENEYKVRLSKVQDNVELIGGYKGMNTKTMHRCKIHNMPYLQTPKNALENKCGCKECQKEKMIIVGQSRRTDDEIFKKRLFEKYGDKFIPLEPYIKSDVKIKFLHNIKNGTPHTFYSTPNCMLQGQGCGVCTGKQVCIGYNDLNTVHPELSKYLLNYDDGYNVTSYSGKEITLKCPYCGYTKIMRVKDFVINGFSCPVCGDGISYPNKFIFNILLQIKEELDFLYREWKPEWLKFKINNKNKTGKYDIYFGYKNKEYIVEMDGGLGHGNKEYGKSNKEAIEIDMAKDKLAKEHNIDVIRIDCNYKSDPYEFIKENIINSKLNEILNLSKIDFVDANLKSRNSYVIKAVELWKKGLTVLEIGEELNLYPTTITNYLFNMAKINKCTYNKEESKNRSTGHAVICLNDKKIFDTIILASKFYNIPPGDISKCCRRKATFGGWYNGQKMIFMYLSEYNKMSESEIEEYIPKVNEAKTKVVCLDTNEIFEMMKDGAKWSNQKTSTGILNCCKGKYKTAGKHPQYGYPLHWMYYEDYINATEEQINKIINYKFTGWKSVICLNNLNIFDDAIIASNWCGLKSKLQIQRCCRGEVKFAGKDPETNEDLKWMYYKDYLKLNNKNNIEEKVS